MKLKEVAERIDWLKEAVEKGLIPSTEIAKQLKKLKVRFLNMVLWRKTYIQKV